jgi:hypothetical protein
MVSIDGEVVNMHEIVERKFAGDKVKITFVRDRQAQQAEVTLTTLPAARMYAIQYEKEPRYIVFAGLVFQPLDTNLFATRNFSNIHVRRIYADYVPKGLFQQLQDVVVLTRIESDPLTSQLDGFEGMVLEKINSVPVKSLAHAHQLLHPAQPPEFFVLEFFGAPRPIVLPAAEVPNANRRIQTVAGIEKLANLEE